MTYKNHIHYNHKENKNDLRFVFGLRTAFSQPGTVFAECDSVLLLGKLCDLLIRRLEILPTEIKNFSFTRSKFAETSEDISSYFSFADTVKSYSLNNSSGLLTVITACNSYDYEADGLHLCAGSESQADYPIAFSKEARGFLIKLAKTKSPRAKLNLLRSTKASIWMPKVSFIADEYSIDSITEELLVAHDVSQNRLEEYENFSIQRFNTAKKKGLLLPDIAPIWSCFPPCNLINEDDEPLPALVGTSENSIYQNIYPKVKDGAAVCLIASAKDCFDLGLNAPIKIADRLFFKVLAKDILFAPALAITIVLERNNLKTQDISVYEIHESSSAQMILSIENLGLEKFTSEYFGPIQSVGKIDLEQVNSEGGSLAHGHPESATGIRLLNQAVRQMLAQEASFAVVVTSQSNGLTCAMLLERVS